MIASFTSRGQAYAPRKVITPDTRLEIDSREPKYSGLSEQFLNIYNTLPGSRPSVELLNDHALPPEQVLAARKKLFQFFETPSWLWSNSLPSEREAVAVRLPSENRSVWLRAEPLTSHDYSVAKMLELGDSLFREAAFLACKQHVATMRRPEVDPEDDMTEHRKKHPIRPVPDGTMSLEMMFNNIPMTVKGSRTSGPAASSSHAAVLHRRGPTIHGPQWRYTDPAARRAQPSLLRTALGLKRDIYAGLRALTDSVTGAAGGRAPARGSYFNNAPPRDPRNPAVAHFAHVILAMVAGGLLASAMIGAGVFSAPATGLTITCSALLGVWFAYLAIKEAYIITWHQAV